MTTKVRLTIVAGLAAISLGVLTGTTVAHAAEKLTVGSVTSDANIWRHIAKSSAAKRQICKLKLRNLRMVQP